MSDRYFYDSLVNIAFLEKAGELEFSLVIPAPDLAIYLKVDPKIIMQRERKPDQGLGYLEQKEQLLTRAVEKWQLVTIEGDREQAIIFDELKAKI